MTQQDQSLSSELSTDLVHIQRYDICLADLGSAEFRSLIKYLNVRSNDLGCVVFRPPGGHDCVATIFAGNMERFFMLAIARKLRCPVIYLQDPSSFWYQGSNILPDLDTLCRSVIIPETGNCRALLFGQSSGAYAALAASSWLPGSTVVACAPQAFSDAHIKDRIRFVGVRALKTPEGLIDLRERFANVECSDGMRATIIAAGEVDNPAHSHWWGDHIHLMRLAELSAIDTFIVNDNTHTIVQRRANLFAELIANMSIEIGNTKDIRLKIIEDFLKENFAARSR